MTFLLNPQKHIRGFAPQFPPTITLFPGNNLRLVDHEYFDHTIYEESDSSNSQTYFFIFLFTLKWFIQAVSPKFRPVLRAIARQGQNMHRDYLLAETFKHWGNDVINCHTVARPNVLGL